MGLCSSSGGVDVDEEIERSPDPHFDRYHRLRGISKNQARMGLCGLRNLGNTCFMNTALQCLANAEPLTDFFLFGPWKSDLNPLNPRGLRGAVARAYGNLVQGMWTGSAPALSPSSFKRVISEFAPSFSGHQQHDAQEFLAFLLDGLHEDLNRAARPPTVALTSGIPPPSAPSDAASAAGPGLPAAPVPAGPGDRSRLSSGRRDESERSLSPEPGPEPEDPLEREVREAQQAWQEHLQRNQSVVVDLFQGQLRSCVRCIVCGFSSVKFDPFEFLSLPLEGPDGKATSLAQALQIFTAEELLEEKPDGSAAPSWWCPRCARRVPATKKLDLWRLPPILIIHLKRFKFHRDGTRRKITSAVRFPLTCMDLSPFSVGHDARRRGGLFAAAATVFGASFSRSIAKYSGNSSAAATSGGLGVAGGGGSTLDGGGASSASAGAEGFAGSPTSVFSSQPSISETASWSTGELPLYNLFAVSNHHGGLGGGHYTAQALNFVTGNWYLFNDSMVARASSDDINPRDAYVLFYSRLSGAAARDAIRVHHNALYQLQVATTAIEFAARVAAERAARAKALELARMMEAATLDADFVRPLAPRTLYAISRAPTTAFGGRSPSTRHGEHTDPSLTRTGRSNLPPLRAVREGLELRRGRGASAATHARGLASFASPSRSPSPLGSESSVLGDSSNDEFTTSGLVVRRRFRPRTRLRHRPRALPSDGFRRPSVSDLSDSSNTDVFAPPRDRLSFDESTVRSAPRPHISESDRLDAFEPAKEDSAGRQPQVGGLTPSDDDAGASSSSVNSRVIGTVILKDVVAHESEDAGSTAPLDATRTVARRPMILSDARAEAPPPDLPACLPADASWTTLTQGSALPGPSAPSVTADPPLAVSPAPAAQGPATERAMALSPPPTHDGEAGSAPAARPAPARGDRMRRSVSERGIGASSIRALAPAEDSTSGGLWEFRRDASSRAIPAFPNGPPLPPGSASHGLRQNESEEGVVRRRRAFQAVGAPPLSPRDATERSHLRREGLDRAAESPPRSLAIARRSATRTRQAPLLAGEPPPTPRGRSLRALTLGGSRPSILPGRSPRVVASDKDARVLEGTKGAKGAEGVEGVEGTGAFDWEGGVELRGNPMFRPHVASRGAIAPSLDLPAFPRPGAGTGSGSTLASATLATERGAAPSSGWTPEDRIPVARPPHPPTLALSRGDHHTWRASRRDSSTEISALAREGRGPRAHSSTTSSRSSRARPPAFVVEDPSIEFTHISPLALHGSSARQVRAPRP